MKFVYHIKNIYFRFFSPNQQFFKMSLYNIFLFVYTFQVEENDGFSGLICGECSKQMQNAFDFKLKATTSDISKRRKHENQQASSSTESSEHEKAPNLQITSSVPLLNQQASSSTKASEHEEDIILISDSSASSLVNVEEVDDEEVNDTCIVSGTVTIELIADQCVELMRKITFRNKATVIDDFCQNFGDLSKQLKVLEELTTSKFSFEQEWGKQSFKDCLAKLAKYKAKPKFKDFTRTNLKDFAMAMDFFKNQSKITLNIPK